MKSYKTNDRSRCRICDAELTKESAYGRKDTLNQLHAFCKKCYLEIQKERALRVKTAPYTYLVERGDHRPFRLYFKTLREKQEFIVSWHAQMVCSNTVVCVSDSEHLREGCSSIYGDPDKCDECGGKFRYDSRGYLVCEECGLVADVIPFYREAPLPLLQGRHTWNGSSADSQCSDAFYSRAYNRG